MFHLPDLSTRGFRFFIAPERGIVEAAGAEKEIYQKWMRHRSFSTCASKLDHFQPVKLILFQKMSTFLAFILSYYPRERKKGRDRG